MLVIRQNPSPTFVAAIAASSFAILVQLARYTIRKKQGKQTDGSLQSPSPQLPPYAPTTMLKTMKALTNGEHPWFFLRLQKQLLPVKLFRLPFPRVIAKYWIIIGDAKIATHILKDASTTRPRIGYAEIDACIGSGPSVTTMEGEGWKHRRLATNVAFSSKSVKRMGAVTKKCTQDWVKNTLEPLGDKSFDVGKEMVRLTISITLEAALEYKATKTEADYLAHEFLLASQEFVKVAAGMNPFRQLFGYFNQELQRAKLAKRNVFEFAHKILDGYRGRLENNDTNGDCLLRCIMENPNYDNDDERASDIVMWMYAGFDNTGYTIAWVLLDLARNPTIVASLRGELKEIHQDDWHKSPPLRNFVKESMRLHPASPGGPVRKIGKTFVFDGIVIPKDSMVQLPSILYAQDESVFDNPNEFQPNRWKEKNKSQSMTETFLPFVAGNHNCAGQALANVEVETVIACLLGQYDFKVEVEGEEKYFITFKPVGARLIATKA